MALDTHVMGTTEDREPPTDEPSSIDNPGSIWLSLGLVEMSDSGVVSVVAVGEQVKNETRFTRMAEKEAPRGVSAQRGHSAGTAASSE